MEKTNLQKVIELLEGAGYHVTKAEEEERAYWGETEYVRTGVSTNSLSRLSMASTIMV